MSGRSEAVHARGRVCKISPCSAALLVLCGLLAAEVSAQPRPDGAVGARMAPSPERMPSQEPADRRLQWLMIPQVTFRDASLESVLDHFRRKADEASGGAVQVCFKLELPADFRPRYALTLDVRGMPFLAALGYLGELAGVQFLIRGTTFIVRPEATASLSGSFPRISSAPPPASALFRPVRGLTGRLGEPSWPVYAGHYVWRTLAGTVDPKRSGYIKHRRLNGLPVSPVPAPGAGGCRSCRRR